MGLGFSVVGRERGSRSPFPFISPRSRLARLNNGYCFRNPPSIPASINIFPRKRSNSPSSSSTLTISYYLNHVIRDERMNNETLSRQWEEYRISFDDKRSNDTIKMNLFVVGEEAFDVQNFEFPLLHLLSRLHRLARILTIRKESFFQRRIRDRHESFFVKI